MTNAFCNWREEDVVDLVYGNLSDEKQIQLHLHLNDCEHCAAVYREWSAILNPTEPLPLPSPTVKRRLLRRIALENWLSSMRTHLTAIYPAMRTAALLLCIVGLFSLHEGAVSPSELSPADLPRTAVTRDVSMVMDPHTVLHVVPVDSSDTKSYVWVNDASNEILILTEGLSPLTEKDYQVWFISQNRRSHVGLLRWKDGMAHLYFRGGELRQVENIAVSIEPKGGSFIPTGPDTIFVNLR
ncbi:anti-sigma factor [Brevibacillus humidisoli]|uniref:anti-sigma factor n=1 Tax=Brevibacillus humidisoli TaxID=2895522 RepID=UPI001E3DF621|nr:anti-sigma factor [Brevibacillus humidisoli]UFJ39705.1 anti-sigma factor [Brevibacillus humidisoli]